MKKILKFLLIALPWFIGGLLFRSDTIFYKSLNKPAFAPPSIVFPIVWTILYILIAISIYLIYRDNNYKNIPNYNKTLLINYFSNQIFSFLFFTLKSPFLALIDTIIVLISSLFLYYESKELNKTSSKLLIPYIIWNIFATILIISIFFMNL
ncbi:MAG: tryptophan-rich sensory protein [Firmicutes bacterium]|nr:tryptophan-rich sensory protein [Bacillota bacterium]